MIRVSTPRRFILSGTKRDRPSTLLVCTPAREQGRKSWSSPRREKYLRLFFEVYGLALRDPQRFPWFLQGVVGDWLPLVERAFAVAVPSEHAQALATLGLAVVRGLQLDLLAIGERVRTESAFRELMKLFPLAIRSWRKANASQRPDGHRARS
jgi:hypothetical protein